MKESTTYQAILREGEDKGHIEEARKNLVAAIEEKFDGLPPGIAERIQMSTDLNRIRAAIRQVFRVSSTDELVI